MSDLYANQQNASLANANIDVMRPRGNNLINLRIKALIFFVAILYVSTTIFTPKVNLGFFTIYLFEPFILGTVLYLLMTGQLGFSSNIEKTYLLFLALTVFTYLEGPLYTGHFDIVPALLIMKYSLFVMMIPVVAYLKESVSERIFIRVIHSQFIFVLLAGLYVVINMIFNPISLSDMLWGYSPEYRLIGFTGKAIGINGLMDNGNTSVQMGVYTGFLFLIAVSLHIHLKQTRYLLWSLVIFFGTLLTYSRSGLLVIFLGTLYLLIDKAKNKRVILLFFGTIMILIVLEIFFDLSAFLTSFGSLGKLDISSGIQDSSAQTRLRYLMMAMNYVSEHPAILFFGTGYGESYTYQLIGTPHLESLIFTTLFQSGIFALLLLTAHFYYVWKYANKYSRGHDGNVYRAVLYASKIYIPGLLVANLVGGNSLQTDFMAPFFYFIFGVGIYRCKSKFSPGVT